jgi:hypothetical protein
MVNICEVHKYRGLIIVVFVCPQYFKRYEGGRVSDKGPIRIFT